jgi:FtsH-binding integral membrane protein
MNTAALLVPDQAHRRHRMRVWVAMSLYLALLLGCVYLIKHQHPSEPLLVVLALLPTVPVIWLMWSLYVYLTQPDELQRRVHLTSLSMAAGVTAFLTLHPAGMCGKPATSSSDSSSLLWYRCK